MKDTLERERLIDNLIDLVYRLQERVAALETRLEMQGAVELTVAEPATGKRFTLEIVDLGDTRGKLLKARQVG